MKLLSLTFENFKGIRSLTLNFDQKHTFIHGMNGTGKTSVFDGYLWLLFGKDSQGKSDSGKSSFEVKTLDAENKFIPHMSHSVKGVFDINGITTSIGRTKKDKWVRTKGEETPVYKEDENTFTWNNVEVSATEYQKRIGEIINESTFKMLSDPLAFNSLSWQERRLKIAQLVGFDDSDKYFMGLDSKYSPLLSVIQNKSLEDYRKEIASSRILLKNKLEEVPVRINEKIRELPESEPYYIDLEEEKKSLLTEIVKLDEAIADGSKGTDLVINKLKVLNDSKFKVSTIISNLEFAAKKEILNVLNSKKTAITECEDQIDQMAKARDKFTNDIVALKREREELVKTKADLTAEFYSVRDSKFDSTVINFICPACLRKFDENEIVSKSNLLVASFAEDKKKKLDAIELKGGNAKRRIEEIDNQIKEIEADIEMANDNLSGLKSAVESMKIAPSGVETEQTILSKNPEYAQALESLDVIQKDIDNISNSEAKVDNSEIINKKNELQSSIEAIDVQLRIRTKVAETNTRIAELTEEGKRIGQELSTIEKTQFLIEDYSKFKVRFLNDAIEKVFPFVRFKMIKVQNNGGLDDSLCETLVNGVTWTDLNTAGRINAGMEIISVMQKKNGLFPPIFIDNRESVTDVFETEAQTINLVVDPTCNVLTIK